MMKKIFAALVSLLAWLPGFGQTPAHTSVQHPEWSRNAVIYEVNTRQYTPEGTFDAFRAHIPRLKELGVDILWFMPIHPISEVNRKGELGSYYAVADYKGVNPEFGDLGAFRRVVDDAHAAGMKVIVVPGLQDPTERLPGYAYAKVKTLADAIPILSDHTS